VSTHTRGATVVSLSSNYCTVVSLSRLSVFWRLFGCSHFTLVSGLLDVVGLYFILYKRCLGGVCFRDSQYCADVQKKCQDFFGDLHVILNLYFMWFAWWYIIWLCFPVYFCCRTPCACISVNIVQAGELVHFSD